MLFLLFCCCMWRVEFLIRVFLVSGTGSIAFYMVALATNIPNFNPKHRGKFVGTMDGSFSAGPAILAFVYGSFFVNGHVTDEENQNLKGYFLLLVILSAVVGVLGWLFLKQIPFDTGRQHDLQQATEDTPLMTSSQTVLDITGMALLKRFDFHFLFWTSAMCGGLQLMYQNNITAYLKSFGQEGYSTLFTTLNPIAAVASKFLAGFLSDALLKKIPRTAILFIYNLIQTLVLTCCIFFGNKLAVTTTTVIIVGMANGAMWCLTPVILSEYFGLKYFGRNWGLFMLGNAVSGLVLQEVYGRLYDSSIEFSGRTQCYGLKCFRWSFTTVAVLSLCSCIFNIGLVEKDSQKYRKQTHSIQASK